MFQKKPTIYFFHYNSDLFNKHEQQGCIVTKYFTNVHFQCFWYNDLIGFLLEQVDIKILIKYKELQSKYSFDNKGDTVEIRSGLC